MSTVVSCLCNHQYLHVVWLSNMVNHHLELGKLASNEGYVLDGGRVALEKKVFEWKGRLRSKPAGQKSDHASPGLQGQHGRQGELGSRPARSQ